MSTMPTSQATVSSMLRKVTADMEMETAITLAEVINVYMASLRRVANRTTLGPEDAIRILHMHQQIMEACSKTEQSFDFRPKAGEQGERG